MRGDLPGCRLHCKVLPARSRVRRGIEAGPRERRTEQRAAWAGQSFIRPFTVVFVRTTYRHGKRQLCGSSLKAMSALPLALAGND